MTSVARLGAASALVAAATALAGACGGGGGGYGSSSTPTSPTPQGGTIPTITIRAGGTLDPQELRIDVNQQVRFVNEDSQAHQPASNPHPQHSDCPQTNITALSPGQSATTSAFNAVKACGYHDHMNPDATRLHGTIRVGGADGPSGPVYVVVD